MTAVDTAHSPAPVAAAKVEVERIAYLCAQYPAISHTFILREVDALRALGVEVDTFSIRRADSGQLLARADRAAYESTFTILPPVWRRLLGAHLKLAIRSPSAYVSTLMFALGLAPRGLRGRLWQVLYFIEAVALWSELRDREIRHIHAHLANVGADVALLTARLGTAVDSARPWSWSFTMHGPAEFANVGHYRLAEKLRYARFVVCISDYARSQLMTLGDPEVWRKLHVVHVGIPVEQFTRSEERAFPAAEPTILCVGRLVPEKGQAVLLEAVAQLADRGQDVKAIVAGAGPSKTALEDFAERLGIASRVRFTGAVGQEEIHALYTDASIFCLPSFAEGVPVVLMEAMAMRLPVISTRIAGIPELIDDGRSGLLVAPGRPDQLADAFARLLADPAFCREIEASARAKVIREFDVEQCAAQLQALFADELSPIAQTGAR